MLRIIQIQVVDVTKHISLGELIIDRVVPVLVGLGLDGIVYKYDDEEKHWTPITTRRVNPLHKQSKKQRIIIDEEEGHV